MNRTNSTAQMVTSGGPGCKQNLKLIVRRLPESKTRFNLIVIKGGTVLETVTADSAQLIKDYIDSEWPVGTQVQWLVI